MAEVSPRPDDSGVPTLEAPQAYRPLSLLAVLALVLGVLFAVVVLVGGLTPFARAYPRAFVLLLLLGPIGGGLGAVLTRQKGGNRIASFAAVGLGVVVVLIGLSGLVAFSSTSPWLLGGWEWVLLIATVLVALISLSQIRAAEGTLAGRECARWGLWLALFFGGYYLLYIAGNVFAVNAQAAAATDHYVDLLVEGKLPEAFVEALKPGSRPTGDLESEIQAAHNVPRGPQPGEYSMFCGSPLVQRLKAGGKATKTRQSSSTEYHPTQGYIATVAYEIKNDLGRFGIEVKAQSVDIGGTRQWQILPAVSQVTREIESTALGNKFDRAIAQSRDPNHIGTVWIRFISQGTPELAYLLTRPPLERPALEEAYFLSGDELGGLVGLALPAYLTTREKPLKELKEGAKSLGDGKFIDLSGYRAPVNTRDRQIRQVRERLKGLHLSTIQVESIPMVEPMVQSAGDEMEIRRPIRFTVYEMGKDGRQVPSHTIEGNLVSRGNQVISLELVREGKPSPMGP